MRKFMNINHLVMLTAMAVAVSMVSCIKDEVVDAPSFHPTESELIAFGVSGWGDMEDITRGGATPNRIGNRELKSADGEFTLPMGIYVEDGIRSTSSENAETRGSVVSSADGITSFNVWAQFTKADNSTMSYFEDVKYNNTDGVFYPENAADEYYWPGSGTLDFTAVANASDAFVPVEADGAWTGYFQYSTPADATAQNDIMVAYSPDVAGDNNASVPLTFRHIMSAVNIKIGSVVSGEIRSIKLTNVYNRGVFDPTTLRWTIDESSKADYAVVFDGDKFTVDANTTSGTLVNASDATFFFIPQEPAEGAEMIVEFYDGTTGRLYSDDATKSPYAPALRGSIAGDVWDMAKTTNYNLSIDESFTLIVEPVGKKLDAHYIISEVNVTVDGISNWQITATASDGANVSIQRYSDANPLAQQGYWTDVVVDSNGVETTESARGKSAVPGTGSITNEKFLVFIPENVSDKDREIKIILSSTDELKPAETTKVLLQKFPNWTGDCGWEVVDDDEAGKYGFKWTRMVAYIYPYSRLFESTAKNFCQDFIDDYGAGENDFATVGTISLGWGQNRAYILLNYSVLNNVEGADSNLDGLQNTEDLYNAAGTTSTAQFETIVTTTMKTESSKETENMFRLPNQNEISKGCPAESGTNNDLSAIMEYVQKKNRYCIQKSTVSGDSTGNVYIPYFQLKDLKWYLPAYGEFPTNVDFTPEDSTDSAADYWSSTIGTTTTTAFIGNGTEKDRDEEFKVIAARVNEGGYGQSAVAVTVDNSSMAGGENGEAIWSE